ncbi:MAG: nucleotidyltransferase family protein [Acidimicrobiales bacterium]
MTVAGVLLAAGAGSRFLADGGEAVAEHKLTAPFRGKPVIVWSLLAADEANFNELYVITGAVDVSDLVTETLGDRATVIHNPRWAEGQSTSVRLAAAVAEQDGHRAMVIGLADQPLVPASAWRSVGASAGLIVTASFDGQRRPPVKLERSVWGDLPDSGDEGARSLFRLRPELVSELPCSGNPVDIDTLEDLQQWS